MKQGVNFWLCSTTSDEIDYKTEGIIQPEGIIYNAYMIPFLVIRGVWLKQ